MRLRRNDISTKRFRELASEVGGLLTYEDGTERKEKGHHQGWGMAGESRLESKGKNYVVAFCARVWV